MKYGDLFRDPTGIILMYIGPAKWGDGYSMWPLLLPWEHHGEAGALWYGKSARLEALS